MRRASLHLLLTCSMAAAVLGLPGCGGSLSQADMKRYAIQRATDEEQPAAVPAASAAKPPRPSTNATGGPSVARSEPADVSTLSSTADAGPAPSLAVSAGPLSDTQSPPASAAAELDPDARAHHTVDNLSRIGAAFEAYRQDKQVYPARAIFDRSRRKALLSWRVDLLPYLGYEKLYSRFRLEEPWNSRQNHALLPYIPAVYQSPERFDERTNYLVPVASATIFGRNRGVPPSTIEDGATNTVFVLEVDDAAAVPWTEPRDYDLDLRAPTKQLGTLRSDSFYVVWGSGQVGRILTDAPRGRLQAMFTFDGGENFQAGHIDKPLFAPLAVLTRPDATGETVGAEKRPGNSPSSGARSQSVAHAFTSSDTELLSLAGEFLAHADAELAAGAEREANDWFYAAVLASPPGGAWVERYHWVPALRRPTPDLRFGIGLAYTGPRAAELRPTTARRSTPARAARPWTTITSDLGEELQRILSNHAEQQRGGDAFAGSPRGARPRRRSGTRQSSLLDESTGELLAPGAYFLAAARDGVLREAARREGVDVLVLVEWRERGKHWSANITLFDVARNATLLGLPRIDSGQIEKARTDPLTDNPAAAAFRQLTDFLERELSRQPLPEQIQLRHVQRRLDVLATTGPDQPLRALAEMRYYHERGLADDTQLLLAFQALVGQKPGSELLLGDAATRERLLKQWLPTPPDLPTARTAATDDD